MDVWPVAFIEDLRPKDWLQIGLLFVGIYLLLRFLRRTIAGGIFQGPAMLIWIVVIGLLILLDRANLEVLNLILTVALPILIVALVITFQVELRHGIARLGRARFLRRLFGRRTKEAREIRSVKEVTRAVTQFSERRIGANISPV